jgi:DNA polymerase-3 subunit delta'
MMTPYAHILGQSAAIDKIEAARAASRLPHGLIFAGPAGVGKGTTAVAFAKQTLSDDPDAARLIDANTHPDVHVVRREAARLYDKTGKSKATRLGIEVVREEVVKPAARSSVRGAGKMFIIEQADRMTTQAQNGLLKTLEEPHGRTLIVLLADEATALLPTIRSRCQLLSFGRLSDADVQTILIGRGLSDADAQAAAALADGSPGTALRYHEDGVPQRATDLFHLIDRGDTAQLPAFLTEAAAALAERALERDPLASKDFAAREAAAMYLTLAAHAERRRLRREPAAEHLEAACNRIDAFARAEVYLAGNVNTSLVYQQLALALA